MTAWPAPPFPQLVLRAGYREGFKNTTLYSDTDSGIQKRRRVFTNAPEQITTQIVLTSDELNTFKQWFNDDIAGGALSFTRPNPRTQVVERFAFRETPEGASSQGHNQFVVTLEIDRLPQ